MNLSFIKLDIQILNDTKIKLIRKMPEGHQLFTMWIGILCLAMRSSSPGELLIAPGLPFTDEALSLELDLSLSIIRLGLDTFTKLKMVTTVTLHDITVISITNFASHQSLERLETFREQNRERVRKHREKQRLLLAEGQDVTHYAITCNAIDKNKIRKEYSPNSDEFRLSSILFNKIKERDVKYKEPNLQKWSNHIDKIHRIDKREFPEIESVITWCQSNSFWQNNILSTDKLRKQFEKLYLQMKSEKDLQKSKFDSKDSTPASHKYL